jgi:hypothetical protein
MGLLDKNDKVGIDDERGIIQPGHGNHKCLRIPTYAKFSVGTLEPENETKISSWKAEKL